MILDDAVNVGIELEVGAFLRSLAFDVSKYRLEEIREDHARKIEATKVACPNDAQYQETPGSSARWI